MLRLLGRAVATQLLGSRYEAQAVDDLFRHAHSIKCMAASMGFEEIVDLSRSIEQMLGELRSRRACLPEDASGELLRASDLLTEMIRRRGAGELPDADGRLPLILVALARLAPDRGAPSSRDSRAAVEDLEEAMRERLRTVRVGTDTLDGLLDTASELLLGVARRRELGREGSAPPERSQLEEGIQRIHGGALELHGQVVKARLMPFAVLTDRLPQHVRELAHRTGREVELRVVGAELELDRSIVEGLTDILLHLLRNCVAHGIEPVAERAAKGKQVAGKLTVEAWREQDQLLLEVADDGRGFDLRALRAAAVKAGRMPADLRSALAALRRLEVLDARLSCRVMSTASRGHRCPRAAESASMWSRAAVEALSGTLLHRKPAGTLARAFASHCRCRWRSSACSSPRSTGRSWRCP